MENSLIVDDKTYLEIQKLQKFVDFISNLKYATVQDKANCIVIKQKIENVNNPETFNNWNICLDIFDYEVQGKINGAVGVYWRTWLVFFENSTLEIEAKSEHTDNILEHYENHFYYYGYVNFKHTENLHKVALETDIDLFIKDALNFENYTTEKFNEIEIDISL